MVESTYTAAVTALPYRSSSRGGFASSLESWEKLLSHGATEERRSLSVLRPTASAHSQQVAAP